jgi:hypothetical protein
MLSIKSATSSARATIESECRFFLNRYRPPGSYLDSMLLTRPSKNVYRQHRSKADSGQGRRDVRLVPLADIRQGRFAAASRPGSAEPPGVPEAIVGQATQEGAGDFVSIPHGSRLRPVAAIKAWLEAAGITEGSIFRSIKKGGSVTLERLSDRSVAQIIKVRRVLALPQDQVE